ncbi:MAG: hypothetical protein CTY13_02920 [Methylobacter sp.]|nr:MAG: hypothetical protein CTY13_02920 [Methylobacter sp.]
MPSEAVKKIVKHRANSSKSVSFFYTIEKIKTACAYNIMKINGFYCWHDVCFSLHREYLGLGI